MLKAKQIRIKGRLQNGTEARLSLSNEVTDKLHLTINGISFYCDQSDLIQAIFQLNKISEEPEEREDNPNE